jgi:hypothetical protein
VDGSQSRGHFELIKPAILDKNDLSSDTSCPPKQDHRLGGVVQYINICDQITAQLRLFQRYGSRTG